MWAGGGGQWGFGVREERGGGADTSAFSVTLDCVAVQGLLLVSHEQVMDPVSAGLGPMILFCCLCFQNNHLNGKTVN